MIAYKNWLVFRRLWLPLLIVGFLVCFGMMLSGINRGVDWLSTVGVVLLLMVLFIWIPFGTYILTWLDRRPAYRELFQAYKKMRDDCYEEARRTYPSQHLGIHGENEEEWLKMVEKQRDYAFAKEEAWVKQFKKQFKKAKLKEHGSVACYPGQVFREAVKEVAKWESHEREKEKKGEIKEQAGMNSEEEIEALQRFADQKGTTYSEAVLEKATELAMQRVEEWGTPEEARQWFSLVNKLKKDYKIFK